MSDLFKIAGPNKAPHATVLLVHGLAGHHFDTWRICTRFYNWHSDPTFWPLWLARDCEEIAIYSIGFDAPVSRLRGTSIFFNEF
jgi:hypothetical protein